MLIMFNKKIGINKNIVGLLTKCNQNKFLSTIYRIYTFRLLIEQYYDIAILFGLLKHLS